MTPFHFGPGAAVKAAVPRRFSLSAFVGVNLLIDSEAVYYFVTRQYPLHRFLHTYVGATLAAVAVCVLVLLFTGLVRAFGHSQKSAGAELLPMPIVVGAALGAYSHIVLDSMMHTDIRPLAPFSDGNGLHRVITLAQLHWFCIISGIIGIAGLVAGCVYRRWSRR
ncbi:MAG: hypothetical protein RDV41_09110 [Planctomycetota bacterium]|nr:hypothetical protein [Planctomycetota bacterium]